MTGNKGQSLPSWQDADARRSDAGAGVSGRAPDMLAVDAFDPADVRPWRFHNRSASGYGQRIARSAFAFHPARLPAAVRTHPARAAG